MQRADIKVNSIPKVVWTLGFIMFLVNLSFIMVYSYVGIYMSSLGVTMGWIGIVEGLAEGCSYLMKLFSGMFSDYWRRRKPVMVAGYILIVLSRIIFSLSSTFSPLFTARMMERIGNGIQSTPRDTMVADVAPQSRIGEAYGIKRTLAQLGALIGAVCAIWCMKLVDGDYQKVFQIASLPAILAFIILIFFVKEPKKFAHSAVSSEIPLPEQKRKTSISFKNMHLLGPSYWLLIMVAAIFMLSRFGETFLTLHAYKNFGLPKNYAPNIMLIFNAGWCLSSYPVGFFADRMNRYWFLVMGIVFLILSDLLLATATSLTWVYWGCFFWGIQYGVTQNIFLSLISEIVPENLRGTGFGFYYITCAISAYFADHMAGFISQHFGEARAFLSSGLIATVSLLFLIVSMGYKNKKI
jgi:MFS family permease